VPVDVAGSVLREGRQAARVWRGRQPGEHGRSDFTMRFEYFQRTLLSLSSDEVVVDAG
jgi:hypothetical protein